MLEKPKKFLCTLHHSSQTRNKKVHSSLDYTHIINAFSTASHTPITLDVNLLQLHIYGHKANHTTHILH